jgi:hypothetical protein
MPSRVVADNKGKPRLLLCRRKQFCEIYGLLDDALPEMKLSAWLKRLSSGGILPVHKYKTQGFGQVPSYTAVIFRGKPEPNWICFAIRSFFRIFLGDDQDTSVVLVDDPTFRTIGRECKSS